MRTYTSPRRGHCASCEDRLTGAPVYRMDEAYCCIGCAHGGPCLCTYEADMADDGATGLGLLVSPQAQPQPERQPEPAVREPVMAQRTQRSEPALVAVRGTLR